MWRTLWQAHSGNSDSRRLSSQVKHHLQVEPDHNLKVNVTDESDSQTLRDGISGGVSFMELVRQSNMSCEFTAQQPHFTSLEIYQVPFILSSK